MKPAIRKMGSLGTQHVMESEMGTGGLFPGDGFIGFKTRLWQGNLFEELGQ